MQVSKIFYCKVLKYWGLKLWKERKENNLNQHTPPPQQNKKQKQKTIE